MKADLRAPDLNLLKMLDERSAVDTILKTCNTY